MRLNQVRLVCCFLACWAGMPQKLAAVETAASNDALPKRRQNSISWRMNSRQLLFKLLKLSDLSKQRDESPSSIPFNAITLSNEDKGKYTLREIEIDSTPTRRIKAIMTIPSDTTVASPAVVCIPGHNSDRRVVYDKSTPYRGFADEGFYVSGLCNNIDRCGTT